MYRFVDTLCVVCLSALAAVGGGLAAPLGHIAAMVVAMAIGMIVAMGGAFLLTPMAGMFEVMVPGTWAGMVAGMAGVMVRGHLGIAPVALIGGLVGLAVALYFNRLDRRLRGVQR